MSFRCVLEQTSHFSFFTFRLSIRFSCISGTSFFTSPICFSASTISLSTVVMSTKLIPFRHTLKITYDSTHYTSPTASSSTFIPHIAAMAARISPAH